MAFLQEVKQITIERWIKILTVLIFTFVAIKIADLFLLIKFTIVQMWNSGYFLGYLKLNFISLLWSVLFPILLVVSICGLIRYQDWARKLLIVSFIIEMGFGAVAYICVHGPLTPNGSTEVICGINYFSVFIRLFFFSYLLFFSRFSAIKYFNPSLILKKDRPLPISFFAFSYIIAGTFSLVNFLRCFHLGKYFSRATNIINGTVTEHFIVLQYREIFNSLFTVLIAVICLLIGLNLFKLKNWARKLAVVSAIISPFLILYDMFKLKYPSAFLQVHPLLIDSKVYFLYSVEIAFCMLPIWYFSRKKIKLLFT